MSSNSIDVSSLYVDGRLALRKDFKTFARFTFSQLNPQSEFVDSSYLSLLAAKVEACVEGRCKRLMICLPPRSLKSIMVSVALPAWLLGLQPHRQIICASYGQDLADKHARDTRAVMLSPSYRHIFNTRLSTKRLSVNDFMTTEGGFRMATSVGGVLTGRGGDFLIIDDPLKPDDAYSDTQRSSVNRWFESTLLSRLNNKQDGVIIVVMQRLHQDDLIGHLLEKGGWELLKLPAIAEEEERLDAARGAATFTFTEKLEKFWILLEVQGMFLNKRAAR